MHNTLLIAVLAGLGGMIGWGMSDFFAKKAVDVIDPIKSLVWAHSFGTVLFILIALGQVTLLGNNLAQPSHISTWLALAGFGALQMVVYWLLYKGFEKGQLAVLNPVFASFSGVVALIAIVVYGEKASLGLITALIAIFLGILLLNMDISGLKSKKLNVVPGLKEVGVATALAAIWTLGWDKFVTGHDSLVYSLWMYFFMSLAAFALSQILRVKLKGVPRYIWKYLMLIGAGETLAYLAISWGYSSTALTGVVALISGAFSVPTVILAYIFLRERVEKIQAVGILVIIVGIVLVSVA